MMFGMGLGLVLALLVAVPLIVGAVFLVRWLVSGGSRTGSAVQPPSPREILDQRVARGEISREEYEQMRADLAL